MLDLENNRDDEDGEVGGEECCHYNKKNDFLCSYMIVFLVETMF